MLALFSIAIPAEAQRDPRGDAPSNASSPNEVAQPGEPIGDDDMNLETATPDPSPPVPRILQRDMSEARLDVIEQAGVGGPTAYASAGVLEVGGTGSLFATDEYVGARLAPFVGWFLFDGIELSYIHEIYGGAFQGERFFGTVLYIELSAHLRFGDRLLGFLGLAPGLLYNGEDTGFAIKPRMGFDVLVGRSGIFRPDIYFVWATDPLIVPVNHPAAPSARWGYGLEISYAAMF